MSDEKHEMELDPGAAIVRGFMYRALEIMARDLQERAAEADGALDGDAVAASLAGMKDPKSPVMGAICRAAWQECERLFESEARKEDRKAPFERLMVWPFAHLLPAGGSRDGGEETISRRIIPGFMAAIEDMVGPVVFGRQQERCRELVQGIRNKRGGAFTWDDVYADTMARVIVDDILVGLAMEFQEFEEQRDWFIGLVNDAMPLPTNGSGHATALDDEGFAAIMRALYDDLARRLETEDGDAMIAARSSRPAVDRVLAFLEELDAIDDD
jgi:hypothetical protein